MRIIQVPTYMTMEELEALQIVPDATVEAEYGEKVIEGKYVTLAHHAPQYVHCPAPCCASTKELSKDATIIISHIDLDTVGGCLALMGQKTENEAFWSGAGFIDCNGIHHIHELSENVQQQLNAVYAWNESQHLERSMEVRDVTALILSFGEAIRKILLGDFEMLADGERWAKEVEAKTENCLVWENGRLRMFEIPDNTFCSAAYYSPKYGKIAEATLAYNLWKKSITIAFADGGKTYSAKEIVQEIWGELAGGHRGIAGSPRNQEMQQEDWEKAKEKMRELMG